MFSKKQISLLSLALSIMILFCCACGNSNNKTDGGKTESDKDGSSQTDSKPSGSTGGSEIIGMPDFTPVEKPSDTSSEASPSETEKPSDETEKETIVTPKDLLVFNKGLDMYGEKTINIIGDSISQGLNAPNLYDDSWASLFKGAINKKFGANNIGYVSLHAYDDWGVVTCREIHTITDKTGNWSKRSGYQSPSTPGNFSYTAPPYSEGATLEISLNRKEGGKDRHINGFYVYYTAGATYGSFTVKINGKATAEVNCFAQKSNPCARSSYIAIPANAGNNITIEIVKKNTDHKLVTVNGISYIDTPGAVTVNNYSLSGIRLVEYDDALLRQLCKANIVIFTLGTNDAGTSADLETFKHKLSIVSQTCVENGSLLIVGDVIWNRYGDGLWATKYKNELMACAKAADGYYIDFTPLDSQYPNLLADNDICHPTVEGHSLIADKICAFFDIKR